MIEQITLQQLSLENIVHLKKFSRCTSKAFDLEEEYDAFDHPCSKSLPGGSAKGRYKKTSFRLAWNGVNP